MIVNETMTMFAVFERFNPPATKAVSARTKARANPTR